MMAVQSSIDDLWGMMHRATGLYTAALQDVAEASLSDDPNQSRLAVERLADLLWHTLVLSELLGRRRMLLEADAVRDRNNHNDGMVLFARIREEGPLKWEIESDVPMVPEVPFEEAIEDLVNRQPRIIDQSVIDRFPPGTPRYKMIQDIYSRDKAFAMALSNEEHVTKRMQKQIEGMFREGVSVETARGQLKKKAILDGMKDYTEAYGETVYRTSLNTSFSRGLREMANDPAVQSVIGAFEYEAVADPDTRPNHRAADGIIASTHDPIWDSMTPPLGYNCRCSLRLVDRLELEERGMLDGGMVVSNASDARFSDAHPDEGFGRSL